MHDSGSADQVSEYEHVRQSPVHFINARGHEVNAEGWARVVDEFDRYTIVEKIDQAAEIVAETGSAKQGRTMNERKRQIGENEAVFRHVNSRYAVYRRR